MSKLAHASRNSDLAQIHMAVAALRWSDDDYRTILLAKTGKTSSAQLDAAGRKAFLNHLATCGWKPVKKPFTQIDKIAWLWRKLDQSGALRDPSKASLMAFVGRTAGMEVSRPQVSARGRSQQGGGSPQSHAEPEHGQVTNWADLSTELLPQVLQDFVRLVGLPSTMTLVAQYGGRRLYVPLHPAPDHRLAELIGYENLRKLSAVYGREDHFDIPKAVVALRHLRDQRIRAQIGPKSASTLAAENNLTERQIWNIVGRAPDENTQQTQLFG